MHLHLFYAACLKVSINTFHRWVSVSCLLWLSISGAWCNAALNLWGKTICPLGPDLIWSLANAVCVCICVFVTSELFMWSQSQCVFLSLPQWWWWWQWWDYGVGVCSLSTVSTHGLLPPLSFYRLLLGDGALSPNATQAKTPLSSFARACYPGNTAIPPLLFFIHLLSSLISPNSNPSLFSLDWTQIFVFGAWGWYDS